MVRENKRIRLFEGFRRSVNGDPPSPRGQPASQPLTSLIFILPRQRIHQRGNDRIDRSRYELEQKESDDDRLCLIRDGRRETKRREQSWVVYE